MKTETLYVRLGGRPAGTLHRSAGRVLFEYDAAWQQYGQAYPLSVSMPLVRRRHAHAVVEPFLWGLLPDNSRILEAWASRFQVPIGHPFGLLRHVGEDCPGALQILTEERQRELNTPLSGDITWLSEADIEARLRELRSNISMWRSSVDHGQFSLAGAQPKTALCLHGTRWGVPSGAAPTTHILKPGIPDLDGSAENEHFCLELARAVGLPSARSKISRFGSELAIVVERYDRAWVEGQVLRVHQEDMCQALAVHPARKYQSEGGPSPRDVVGVLRNHSTSSVTDVQTFLRALAFNWVIAGTDAHAKNYSLLLGAGGQARLAPLYDVASALPYVSTQPQKLKLAMKLGGTYRLRDVHRERWERLSAELSLGANATLATVRDVTEQILGESGHVLTACLGAGLDHPLLPRLHQALVERAQACLRLLSR